ncbi:unnamed protein product, partial [Prorocentrum cordatum]
CPRAPSRPPAFLLRRTSAWRPGAPGATVSPPPPAEAAPEQLQAHRVQHLRQELDARDPAGEQPLEEQVRCEQGEEHVLEGHVHGLAAREDDLHRAAREAPCLRARPGHADHPGRRDRRVGDAARSAEVCLRLTPRRRR